MPGLDPRVFAEGKARGIHRATGAMDCRVKPGNDSEYVGAEWGAKGPPAAAPRPQASKPPSMLSVAPVTKADAGLARKATALATSSGRP